MVFCVEIEASEYPAPYPAVVVVVTGAFELLYQEICWLGIAVSFLSLVIAKGHNSKVETRKGQSNDKRRECLCFEDDKVMQCYQHHLYLHECFLTS